MSIIHEKDFTVATLANHCCGVSFAVLLIGDFHKFVLFAANRDTIANRLANVNR